MEDLLQLQLLARQQRTPYAVATIVEATGSTPRTEGKMLVYADGRSAGTIGGGLAELRAKKDAADAIRCGKNRLVRGVRHTAAARRLRRRARGHVRAARGEAHGLRALAL